MVTRLLQLSKGDYLCLEGSLVFFLLTSIAVDAARHGVGAEGTRGC